jgi:hypothetical protein
VDIERHHLAEADQHIAKGEQIVARQRQIIAQMRANGFDATDAETTLQLFERSLEAFKRHRQSILDALAKDRD